MAVIVYIESQDGVIKKAGLEVASYGRSIADDQGLKLIGVGFNIKDIQVLELYGLDQLYNIDTQGDSYFDVERYSSNISSKLSFTIFRDEILWPDFLTLCTKTSPDLSFSRFLVSEIVTIDILIGKKSIVSVIKVNFLFYF